MGSFWKAIGKGFAYAGKGALAAALWASQHPEVIQIVLGAVNLPPNVKQGIATGVSVVGAAENKP